MIKLIVKRVRAVGSISGLGATFRFKRKFMSMMARIFIVDVIQPSVKADGVGGV